LSSGICTEYADSVIDGSWNSVGKVLTLIMKEGESHETWYSFTSLYGVTAQ